MVDEIGLPVPRPCAEGRQGGNLFKVQRQVARLPISVGGRNAPVVCRQEKRLGVLRQIVIAEIFGNPAAIYADHPDHARVNLPHVDEAGEIHVWILDNGAGALFPGLDQLVPCGGVHPEQPRHDPAFQGIDIGRFVEHPPAFLKIEEHGLVRGQGWSCGPYAGKNGQNVGPLAIPKGCFQMLPVPPSHPAGRCVCRLLLCKTACSRYSSCFFPPWNGKIRWFLRAVFSRWPGTGSTSTCCKAASRQKTRPAAYKSFSRGMVLSFSKRNLPSP